MTGVFVMPHADSYGEYIEYMGRSEAVRNEHFNQFNAFEDSGGANIIDGAGESQFMKYTDYMSNPEKTKSLFNARYERMPYEDVHYTKDYFQQGQENGSPLWQLVFSFRNEWLEENGLMNQANHELNETKIHDATRVAMAQLMAKEGLDAEWLGSIHFNTKHIHVHVGMVERNPTKELIYYTDEKNPENTGWQYKGKLKLHTINSSKSKFVNNLLNMQEELTKVDERMKSLVTNARKNIPVLKEELFKKSIHELEQKLPKNKKRWTYGYAKGQKFKPELDKVITLYLNTYAKEELNTLISRIDPVSKKYEEAYGNPKNQPTYLDNKLYGQNGLYHTLGNVVLKELKELDKEKKNNRSHERLTLDDLTALHSEEQCVRSDLPSADKLFESNETDEYNFYIENLLGSEEPYYEEIDSVDTISQSLNDLSTQTLVENKLDDAVTRLKEELLLRTPSQSEVAEKLFAWNEEEKRHSEKRGVIIHDNGVSEPVKLVENTTIKGYLAIPSSNKENNETESKNKSKEPLNNLHLFSKKNRSAIVDQNPNATFVHGENQWKLAGKEIKKSERVNPITVYAPKFETDGDTKRLAGFTQIPMFDVSQTVEKKEERFVYKNQERVSIKSVPTRQGYGYSSSHYDTAKLDRQFKNLMNKLEDTTQKYLNEKAFKEMDYQQTL